MGCDWTNLVLMAEPKLLLIELTIHHRLNVLMIFFVDMSYESAELFL